MIFRFVFAVFTDFISKLCQIVPSGSCAGAVGEPSGNRQGAAGSEQHGLNEHEK